MTAAGASVILPLVRELQAGARFVFGRSAMVKPARVLQQLKTTPNLMFRDIPDPQPSDIFDWQITFPRCKTLVMHDCDKNFFYYWAKRGRFPNVEHVVVNGHPADYDRHLLFYHDNIRPPMFWVHKSYKRYFQDRSHVSIINDNHMNLILRCFQHDVVSGH